MTVPRHGARWTWGAVALVALVEAAILTGSAFPDVPSDYRRFFIERSTNCWALEVAGERRLSQNLPLVTDSDPELILGSTLLICGWIRPHHTGTWSRGPEAALRFDIAAAGNTDLVLHLDVLPFVPSGHRSQTVGISVAGEEIAVLNLDAQSARRQVVRIPARLAAAAPAGKLDIWFAFPDAISPSELGITADTRKLAIRLLSIRLEPVPAETVERGSE